MTQSYITELTELPSDPIGGASGEKRFFNARFLGKTNNPDFPYTVANEVVASLLGIALGLHLPVVLTQRLDDDDCALVQWIGRDPSMQEPPPATAKALEEYISQHQHEVHGAIVFDLYVANNDRAFSPMRRNLMLDAGGRLLLYDNGNCCLYRNRPQANIQAGIPRLEAVESDLAAMFDMDHKQNHYREFLTDWALVEEWCRRIQQLPEFLIRSAVDRIPENSATGAERAGLTDFLLRRRTYLLDHIRRCSDRFPGLPPRQEET